MTVTAPIPDHILPECVWDHDFAQFLAEGDDPYLAGARLHEREGPGLIWATEAAHGGSAWIFTHHATVEEGFADYEKFSSKRSANMAVMDDSWMLLPVEADRPDHRFYRGALHPFFTPSAMARRNSAVQELSDQLIAGFVARGSCEFIADLSSILPNAIVISLLGMPGDMLPQFLAWEEDIIHGKTIEARRAAGAAVLDYLKDFIAHGPENELMHGIRNGMVAGRPFSAAEVLGTVYLLFVAGLDTVNSTLGWIMNYLAKDQALQQRLRDHPELIPVAIEEFTRAFGVSAPSRTVAQDMVFHGVPMKKGDPILLPTFIAGRDPRAWPDPHRVDIERRARHATFGRGPHVCLGVHLAKREMRIMIEGFLGRMNNIHHPEGGRRDYHTTNTIGFDRLDLAWDPA